MKKTIYALALIAFMAGTTSISYGQVSENNSVRNNANVRESKKNVSDSKKNLKVDQKKSEQDYKNFKKESDQKFKNNELRISELKQKYSKLHSKEKMTYKKDLAVLEQKNSKMKRDLANYKVSDDDKWTSFKRNFSRDMDGVGQSLKDFTVRNTK